jgi:class 3 adenylate cyclase
VVIGELGTVKMEIAFLGDTMNTAARLQEACRDTGQRVLASAALVNRLAAFPPGIAKRSIGRVCAVRKSKSSSTRSPPLNRQPEPAARSRPFPLD